MRHEDQRAAMILIKLEQQVDHDLPGSAIQVPGGLISQENPRTARKRPGHRYTLLFPT